METKARRIRPQHSASPHDLGLLRELDVIGDRRRGLPALYPVSRSEWRKGVREGRYPPAIKIEGQRLTFWRRADVLALIAELTEAAGAPRATRDRVTA